MCTLYERIQELCKSKGVTGSRMCLELGLSKSTLSDIKSGRKKGISTATAQKIAAYFDVTVGYLLGEEEMPQNKENPTAQLGSEALSQAGYDLLTDENKAFIDQMIAKLVASQSDK